MPQIIDFFFCSTFILLYFSSLLRHNRDFNNISAFP